MFFLILSMYFPYHLPLGKVMALHFNKLESPLLKHALCQVWLNWSGDSGGGDENTDRWTDIMQSENLTSFQLGRDNKIEYKINVHQYFVHYIKSLYRFKMVAFLSSDHCQMFNLLWTTKFTFSKGVLFIWKPYQISKTQPNMLYQFFFTYQKLTCFNDKYNFDSFIQS